MKPINGLLNAGTAKEHKVYAPASEGPFLCARCEYFTDPNKCSHPEIIKLRKGIVEPDACCDYFEKDDD